MTTPTKPPARRPRSNGASTPKPAAPVRAPRKSGARVRNLVIVESPTKARTVEGILGDDYRVIASVGHVRDLPNFGYGVASIEKLDFTPKYVVVKDKRRGVDKTSVIKDIAEAAADADRVYLSTDPDREGEAIAWHIKEAAGIPDEKTTRVVFHEITRPAIEEAFREAEHPDAQHDSHNRKAPGKIDMDLVDAQQARRVLDRLIGFPLTWFVQKKVSRGASAGRVQSVALGLIVRREKEILGFVPTAYWTVAARLAKGAQEFTAQLVRLPGREGSLKPPFRANGPAIPDQATADTVLAALRESEFSVAAVKPGTRSASPAPPFTTSTFQQGASNRLGMGASRAMSIAQELYEGITIPGEGATGLISYMRTDSVSISPVARQAAREYIGGRWSQEHVPAKERVYATRSKGAQEAHEAIRPTEVRRSPEALRGVLSSDQLRVYTLIWQRFVASQMADARYATMAIEIEARNAGRVTGAFRASASQLVFAGFRAVYGVNADDGDRATEDEDETEGALPALVAGEALQRRTVTGERHETEPPPRFTEASLVKALEEEGIGRPSTYASIVQTVQKREYVHKEGRALVPLELGFIVHDLLEQHMKKYVDVPFTGEMEEELDEVASGARDYDTVLKEFWPPFKEQLDRADESVEKLEEPTDIRCDACGEANLVIKRGRYGKFLMCPRFPECRNTMNLDAQGKPVQSTGPKATEYACPKCGGDVVQKSGPFGAYVDCVNREAGKCDFRAGVPVGVECPEEPGTGQLVEKKTRRGTFYGCWNYPNCSYTTNTLEPAKMTKPRPQAERDAANLKLLERSARGKAAFASRRAKAAPARR